MNVKIEILQSIENEFAARQCRPPCVVTVFPHELGVASSYDKSSNQVRLSPILFGSHSAKAGDHSHLIIPIVFGQCWQASQAHAMSATRDSLAKLQAQSYDEEIHIGAKLNARRHFAQPSKAHLRQFRSSMLKELAKDCLALGVNISMPAAKEAITPAAPLKSHSR
ncbi:MAG: hypothetical protein FWG10_00150 [Eubacteriaceae bacterium]|nr:hypothetical protein [Eubacteriaceae bacterium]